jgi:hypothetical protein
MALYSIDLSFQSPEPIAFQGREVFRLVCLASNAVNMPTEIFGHQKTLVDPATGAQQDEFSFICSPYELSIYPAGEPNPTQSPAYFRKAEIDILLPTVRMFEDTKAEINSQVQRLLTLLSSLDNLVLDETVTLSAGTDSSSSSSLG